MKIAAVPIFDDRQAALELGYSEQQIEDFNNLRSVMLFWSHELEDGKVKNSDFPHIDNRRIQALREYSAKVADKKFEFYINNKHLFK